MLRSIRTLPYQNSLSLSLFEAKIDLLKFKTNSPLEQQSPHSDDKFSQEFQIQYELSANSTVLVLLSAQFSLYSVNVSIAEVKKGTNRKKLPK